MSVYQLSPLQDPRWQEFLERHPRATVFHTSGWLDALRRTYGFEPVVYTTCPPKTDLVNGIVFCKVASWITGRRLISVPFSDHCDPLVDNADDMGELLEAVERQCDQRNSKYVELRPLSVSPATSTGFDRAQTFSFHRLDLSPTLEQIFAACHGQSIRKRIRRAERHGFTYEHGRSEKLLTEFYKLLVLTRQRHQVPPQPLEWYRNLVDCLGDALHIHVLSEKAGLLAGVITLSYKQTVVLKYTGSDRRTELRNAGSVPWLYWKVIEQAKAEGRLELDLGRTDLDQESLITFKNWWGAQRSELCYWRYPATSQEAKRLGPPPFAKHVLSHVPQSVLVASGKLLYKHFA